MNGSALYEAVEVRATRGAEQDKVAGTPTFLVNGAAVQPPAGREMDLATLEAAIAAAK